MKEKTGKLFCVGIKMLGAYSYEYFRCVDCGTEYPTTSTNKGFGVSCNGHLIDLCPWCRPDSKPWTNGRGH